MSMANVSDARPNSVSMRICESPMTRSVKIMNRKNSTRSAIEYLLMSFVKGFFIYI